MITLHPNDKLAALVNQWLREGKVSTQPGAPAATLSGTAEVAAPKVADNKSIIGRLFSWL